MTRNTITKHGVTTQEERCYISSVDLNIIDILRVVRNHWHLDVTFKEDSNHRAD